MNAFAFERFGEEGGIGEQKERERRESLRRKDRIFGSYVKG